MMLLVDAGNSRIKWGTLKRTRIESGAPLTHDDFILGAERAWGEMEKPERVVVANVAGEGFADDLLDWSTSRWDVEPEFIVSPAEGCGVRNAYSEPQRLGCDRWAALVAARGAGEGPACVVDCGSAITVDVLDGEGLHLGGLIVPGIDMMGRSLVYNTDGISGLEGGETALLARDTGGAVRGGTLYSAVAFVDRVAADLRAELGPLRLIITGGDAPRLLPLLAGEFQHEPDLVLQGLVLMARGEEKKRTRS